MKFVGFFWFRYYGRRKYLKPHRATCFHYWISETLLSVLRNNVPSSIFM